MRKRDASRPRLFLIACLYLTSGCGEPSIQGRTPEWELEPELRIGSLDDPEQALTSVLALTLGPEGEIYVSQPQEQCIKVFSSSGQFLRTIGRKGEGPGEFIALGDMGWLADTLYVSDYLNQRVSFFGPDGSYLRSMSNAWPMIEEVFSPVLISRLLDDGTALVVAGFASRAIADGTVTAHPVFRMDTTGHVLRKVAEVSVQNSQIAVQVGGGTLYTDQPFGDAPLLGISPSGDFVVILDRRAARSRDDATMHFIKITSNGDTVLTRDIRYDPVPFLTELIDSVLDSRAADRAGMFGSAQEARKALDQRMFRPAFFPPASNLVVADEGWIFVRREALPGPEVLWDALSPEGVHLGSVSLPSSAQVFRATDTQVWTTERDEFDVTYVARYHIRKD